MSLQFIPQSIADIIHKNIHQLRMSTYVFPQMTSIQSHTRRLTYRLQLLANSALLTVHLHLGSIVGQHAYIHHTHTHTRTDIGLHWTLYQNDAFLNAWRTELGCVNQNDPQYHYTDDDWQDFSNKEEVLSNGRHRICIMIGKIPNQYPIDDFEALSSIDCFMHNYPAFIPVWIDMPSNAIHTITTPLTMEQKGRRYGFEKDAKWIIQMIHKMEGLALSDRHESFAQIMEYLIQNPAILIYGPYFRNSLIGKIYEMTDRIHHTYNSPLIGKQSTRSHHRKYTRITSIISRMHTTLNEIRDVPRYILH